VEVPSAPPLCARPKDPARAVSLHAPDQVSRDDGVNPPLHEGGQVTGHVENSHGTVCVEEPCRVTVTNEGTGGSERQESVLRWKLLNWHVPPVGMTSRTTLDRIGRPRAGLDARELRLAMRVPVGVADPPRVTASER
jgi:hypothetical protein